MKAFFENVDPEAASTMSDLSRRRFDLRELRKRLLADTGCDDVDDVLGAVRDGRLPEHPGYDVRLAVQLMEQGEHALHETLQRCCLAANGGKQLPPPHSGMAALMDAIEPRLPPAFANGACLHNDGMSFASESGIQVLVRMPGPQEWSFEWQSHGDTWRLDTAPVAHPGIDSAAHVHRPDGSVVADPLSLPLIGEASAIVLTFLEALARSPTLGLD